MGEEMRTALKQAFTPKKRYVDPHAASEESDEESEESSEHTKIDHPLGSAAPSSLGKSMPNANPKPLEPHNHQLDMFPVPPLPKYFALMGVRDVPMKDVVEGDRAAHAKALAAHAKGSSAASPKASVEDDDNGDAAAIQARALALAAARNERALRRVWHEKIHGFVTGAHVDLESAAQHVSDALESAMDIGGNVLRRIDLEDTDHEQHGLNGAQRRFCEQSLWYHHF